MIVKQIYNITNFNLFKAFEAKQQIVRVFESIPASYADKYTGNARYLHRIKQAWTSKVFGGSALNSIKAAETGIGGIKEKHPLG